MRHFFLFTIFLLVSSQAHSQWTCSSAPTVNLTTGNGPLARLPAMDQGGSGLCYAFTVSQLADAYRYSRRPGQTGRISPSVLGMLTPSTPFDFNVRGGSAVEAVDALNRYSRNNLVCDDSYIRSILGNTNDQARYFLAIDEIYKQIDFSCRGQNPDERMRMNAMERLEDTIATSASLRGSPVGGMEDFLNDTGRIVLQLNRVPANEILARYNGIFKERLIFPLVSRMCQGRTVRVPRLHLLGIARDDVGKDHSETGFRTISGRSWPAESLRVAWSRLNQPNAQPLGINFCGYMLNRNRYWIDPGPESQVPCGSHAAVLAGTRCAGGRKQFLLRNSYGADCGRIAPRHRRNCDNRGNIWVDAQHLMLSSYEVYGLKEN